MSELRHCPTQKRWVIIATERVGRPQDFAPTKQVQNNNKEKCPFCVGHEDKTPPEIFAIRDNGTERDKPGWKVRVVPNKFPALAIEGSLGRKGLGIYDMMHGIGAHEVIVETINHDLTIPKMDLMDFNNVLYTYRERLKDLLKDKRFKYILIFKNHGSLAGASLSHPHTQLIATPVTPRTVAMELESAKAHYHQKDRCLFCDIIEQETSQGERLIARNERFVAFTPYASRFPFEVFLAPLKHNHQFKSINDEEMLSLAKILKEVLSKLMKALNDPPYNYMIHTSPNPDTLPKKPGYWQTLEFDYHWHIEILPRLIKTAGFEWGTGFYINPVVPEEAARILRETSI